MKFPLDNNWNGDCYYSRITGKISTVAGLRDNMCKYIYVHLVREKLHEVSEMSGNNILQVDILCGNLLVILNVFLELILSRYMTKS